jgi:NDP-sugar pyrophosphorylase family protein
MTGRSAIILAGGRGERLRPLTEDRPKCMIEVLGTPIMAYQLHWLSMYGIQHVVVACGYMHDMVQSYFGSGQKYNLSIEYIIEDEPLGRGGALKRAMMQIKSSKSVVAINGDHLSNTKLDEVIAFHEQHKPMATLVTSPLRSPYGIVETDANSNVVAFREKPTLPYGINAGIYVLSPEIAHELPDKGDHEVTTFPQLAASGKLKAYSAKGFWRTVDTVKDVNELKHELQTIFLGAFFERAII